LIKQIELNIKKGRIKIIQPTQEGINMIDNHETNVIQKFRNPSIEHEYWKKRVAEYYRGLGYEVKEEKHIGDGKSVDIVATSEKENIAIEIETGKSEPINNILKDIESGFDKVISVALNEQVKKKIFSELNEINFSMEDRIEVMSVEDFL